ARAGGWPPYWEQLPGRYLVAGFERSVDAQSVAAAQWSRTGLAEDTRVAADTNGINLLSTYGRHDTVGASLYEGPVWGLRDQPRRFGRGGIDMPGTRSETGTGCTGINVDRAQDRGNRCAVRSASTVHSRATNAVPHDHHPRTANRWTRSVRKRKKPGPGVKDS